MTSTADRLNLLLSTKENIKAAIVEKGQSVGEDDAFSTYPEKILAIKSGGGGEPEPISRQESDYGVIYLANGETGAVEAYTLTQAGWNLMATNSAQDFWNSPRQLEATNTVGETVTVEASSKNILGFDFGNETNLTTFPSYFLYNCYNLYHFSFPEVAPFTMIGSYFLGNCFNFTGGLTLPTNVTSVGSYFLQNCTSFEGPLSIPANFRIFNSGFLQNCSSFITPLTIPATVTTVSSPFMQGCNSFIGPLTINTTAKTSGSTSLSVSRPDVPAYEVGVQLDGAYGFDWRSALTAQNGPTYYRKLIAELPTGVYAVKQTEWNGAILIRDPETIKEMMSGNLYEDWNSRAAEIEFFPIVGEIDDLTTITNFQQYSDQLRSVIGLQYFTQVTSIGDNFLSSCYSLQGEIQLPPNITSIGNNFMAGCSQFNTDLTIPNGVTSIGDYFFSGNSEYTSSLTLPTSLTTIGSYFMSDTSNCTPPILPNGVMSIGDSYLYRNNTDVEHVLPSSLQSIGSYFMAGWPNYDKPLTLPGSLTSIGPYFLYGSGNFVGPLTVNEANTPPTDNYSLATAVVSQPIYATGITVQGSGTDEWLAALPASTSNPYRHLVSASSQTGNYITVTNTSGNSYTITDSNDATFFLAGGPVNGYSASNVSAVDILPGIADLGVTVLNNFLNEFQELTSLSGLENFTGLTKIGNNFLLGCNKFNQPVAVPDTVTEIGDYFLWRFLNKPATFNSSVTLPSGLTKIGDGFLEYQQEFNQPLTLPDTLTSIGKYFMLTCKKFNQPLTVPAGVTTIDKSFMQQCTAFNSQLTLLGDVTSIGNSFLGECSNFNKPLTIPSTVTSIGEYFLSPCASFNQPLSLPTGITSIPVGFMSNCQSFNQDFVIPEGVTTIGDTAFGGWTNFAKSITLPSTLSVIEGTFLNEPFSFTGPLYVKSTPSFNDPYNNSLAVGSTNSMNAPCYTTGISVVGEDAQYWVDSLPDNPGWDIYRNLKVTTTA